MSELHNHIGRKIGCNSCDFLGLESDMLRAPSPFDPKHAVNIIEMIYDN